MRWGWAEHFSLLNCSRFPLGAHLELYQDNTKTMKTENSLGCLAWIHSEAMILRGLFHSSYVRVFRSRWMVSWKLISTFYRLSVRRLAVEKPFYTMRLRLDRHTKVEVSPHVPRAGRGSFNECNENWMRLIYSSEIGTQSMRPHIITLDYNV